MALTAEIPWEEIITPWEEIIPWEEIVLVVIAPGNHKTGMNESHGNLTTTVVEDLVNRTVLSHGTNTMTAVVTARGSHQAATWMTINPLGRTLSRGC